MFWTRTSECQVNQGFNVEVASSCPRTGILGNMA